MKKLRYIFLAVAAICIAASCVVEEQTVTVEYNVSSAMTKGAGSCESINYVWYALYDLNGRFVADFGLSPVVDGNANCPVTMVKGKSYNVVFVAQHYSPVNGENVPAYPLNINEGRVYMPVQAKANTDAYDLFCGLDTVIEYDGRKPDKVMLQRVVAQVNVLAEQSDWDAARSAGQLPDASQITITGVPAAYDLISQQTVDSKVNVNYGKSPLTGTDLQLGTAYCLADESISLVIRLYKEGSKTKEITVAEVDVEANRKTNMLWSTFVE